MKRKCCREGLPPEPEPDPIMGLPYMVVDLWSEAEHALLEVGEIKYVASFGKTFVSPEVLNEP